MRGAHASLRVHQRIDTDRHLDSGDAAAFDQQVAIVPVFDYVPNDYLDVDGDDDWRE